MYNEYLPKLKTKNQRPKKLEVCSPQAFNSGNKLNFSNRLYVCRHGETNWNGQNKVQGSVDIELNSKGIEQAYKLAEILRDKKIDVIATSSMIRAKQTAEIIGGELGLSISEVMDEFREKDFGDLEGKSAKEYHKIYDGIIDIESSGTGESFESLSERVIAGLEYLYETYKDSNILLVCHGAVMKVIYCYFNDIELENIMICGYEPKNCSLYRY